MLYIEDQCVKVGGTVLPGVIKTLEVKAAALVDEQEVEGSSVRPKQATGYEDVKINIELVLDDTPSSGVYDRLAQIQAAFRAPGQEVPEPLEIVCEDTAVRGVDRVIFKALNHKYDVRRKQLTATLEFWEYIPVVLAAVDAGTAYGSSGGADGVDGADEIAGKGGGGTLDGGSGAGASFGTDQKSGIPSWLYTGPLGRALTTSPPGAYGKKRKSPAVDDADASHYRNWINRSLDRGVQ